MEAEVVFDIGTPDAPGRGEHTASLQLKKTAAFVELLRVNHEVMSQRELAEFVEDNMALLSVLDGEEIMEPGRAIHAIRNISIEKRGKDDHSTADFSAAKSSIEEIEAKAKEGGLPSTLIFSCSPYHGLIQRDIYIRLSIITSSEPRFKLRIVNLEQLTERMAKEFCDTLSDHFPDQLNITPIIGTIEL
jgi:uncharacterized protein YfdQ (DUF2303 family)